MYGTHNQITTKYCEALEEMGSTRAVRVVRRNGSHVYYTYHLVNQ